MFCCPNKLIKCEKLGKCLSYCTRNRAVTDKYAPCITYVCTKQIILLCIHKANYFVEESESMKTAIPKNTLGTAAKVVRRKLRKGRQ